MDTETLLKAAKVAAKNKILDKAKIDMMLMPELIFFTTILFSLKTMWTDQIPTAAVDGKHLFINQDFFLNLPPQERVGLLLHEVNHVAYSHFSRRGKRTPHRWNCAGDYVINNDICKLNIPLPTGGLINPKFIGMSTEQVYDTLPEDPESTFESLLSGGTGTDIVYPVDDKHAKQIQQDVADIVLRAAQAAQSNGQAGNIPGEVMVELDRIINPVLPWTEIFQNYMSQFAKDDYSWDRPNKRYLPEIYLPSAHGEALCNIAAGVDISGSVLDHEFNHFIGELEHIQQRLRPDMITVVPFDTGIKEEEIQIIKPDTNIYTDLKFHGRGGTDIRAIYNWAIKNKPTVLIIFTDGDFFLPETDLPDCPIVWLIHNYPDFITNIGTVIHYTIGKT